MRYRTTGGADRRLTLTTHGVMTTEEGREQARLALADAAMGGDPQGAKAERRAEMTMKELCELYMAEAAATKKQTTLRIDRIRIDRHINPRLGSRKVTDITRGDLQRLMIDVGNGHIRGDATPHTRGIFTFAQERGFVEANPVRCVKRYKDGRRERFLSASELGKLGNVLSAQEKDGSDPRHVAIIRLLLLTGARKNEIARLRWSEVDLEKGLLRLKDSKTGPKVIRLVAVATSLLAKLPKAHSAWVFPDRRHADRPTSNLEWAWVRIRTKAELPDVRIHDLRHSFASMGVAGGEGLVLIGKLLGHEHVVTTNRYAHLSDEPCRQPPIALVRAWRKR